jgi:peptidoglycan/LPS O-acetylase OafA/YrhL
MKHRPELDGLRGIAILIVLGAHTGMPGFADGGGGAGVTLFFVLSGYLITSLLLAEREKAGRVDLKAFYIRRALRLFPALAAVLIVMALLLVLGLAPVAGTEGTNYGVVFLGVIFYVANWVAVAGQSIGMLGHTWSLAVEEQFYILWPTLLLAGLRFGRLRLAIVILVLIFLDTPYRLFLDLHGGFMHVFVGTDSRGDALLFGCVLSLLETRYHQIVGWLGLIGVLALAATWRGDPGLGMQILFIPAGAMAATLAVAGCPAVLAWRPLAFIGKISYGLYLWHGLVIWWALPWPVAVPLSIAIACVSYFVLERRFLRLKDRFGRARPSATAAPPTAPPTAPTAPTPSPEPKPGPA